MKTKIDNQIKNPNISTLFISTSRKFSKNHRRMVYNHLLFDIKKKYCINVREIGRFIPQEKHFFPWGKLSGNTIFLGGINLYIPLTIMQKMYNITFCHICNALQIPIFKYRFLKLRLTFFARVSDPAWFTSSVTLPCKLIASTGHVTIGAASMYAVFTIITYLAF